MKNKLILLALFFYSFTGFAQEEKKAFKIIETKVDTAGTLQIHATIELGANIEPLKTDFVVQDENANKVELLSLEKKGDQSTSLNARLIYFLIDASNYTDGIPIQNFKSTVKESFPLLTENDLINIGYFGSEGEGKITSFSTDFSSNFGLMESDIQRIIASSDSSDNSDIMKAMYDAMDKMNKTSKEGQKTLIVISGGIYRNNSQYSKDDIIARARKLGITIHTVNYKLNNQFTPDAFRLISNGTDGIAQNAESSTTIKNALAEFLENRSQPSPSGDTGGPRYVLTFELSQTPRDGREHFYKIIYNNTEETANFTAPGGSGGGNFLANYGLIIIIIVGLIMGLGYWQYNEMRLRKLEQEEEEAELEAQREASLKRKEQEKQGLLQDLQEKNIRLQEQLRLKEQELAKKVDEFPTVIPAGKLDLKNTIIGGGGSAPVFQVVAGAFSKNYRLNKPTMTIGRGANCDIVIPEQTVSSHHATITIEKGSFFLNDLGSTNGTFVNGTRIDKKLLKSGDIIKMGASNCRFEIS